MAIPAAPRKSADASVKRTTLSEAAHQAIRRSIITGVLAPGSKLVVAALAHALKLSATPINEALAGLEREGLVTCSPHRGYFVRTVTPEDIEETYSVREAFELLAVRNAAKNADKTVIVQLKEILKQARQSLRETDTSRFSDLDLEFHRVIWNSLNNSLATRVGELIGVQIRLLVATTARAPGRFRGAFEEHNDIYQAIRNRDPTRAESSMRTHLHNAKMALERAVLEQAGTASNVSAIGTSKTKLGARRGRTRDVSAQSVPKQRT
jgi:DNA-binding GntR family transcriptional regulator